MKKVAIHSHQGGVGKTTIALIFAAHASRKGRKVCVMDFDFLGCGMTKLRLWDEHGKKYLDHFYDADDPNDFDVSTLLSAYAPGDGPRGRFSLILNQGKGLVQKRGELRLKIDMEIRVANEPLYREIQAKTQILLDALESMDFELVIIDCHPGLGFISDTVTALAGVNVYVATPNRSDCFGLLKELNLKRLDQQKAFLVLNRADPDIADLKSFRDRFRSDEVIKVEAKALLGQLKYLCKREKQFGLIPEVTSLRTWYHIGPERRVLFAPRNRAVGNICSQVLQYVDANGGG